MPRITRLLSFLAMHAGIAYTSPTRVRCLVTSRPLKLCSLQHRREKGGIVKLITVLHSEQCFSEPSKPLRTVPVPSLAADTTDLFHICQRLSASFVCIILIRPIHYWNATFRLTLIPLLSSVIQGETKWKKVLVK